MLKTDVIALALPCQQCSQAAPLLQV